MTETETPARPRGPLHPALRWTKAQRDAAAQGDYGAEQREYGATRP